MKGGDVRIKKLDLISKIILLYIIFLVVYKGSEAFFISSVDFDQRIDGKGGYKEYIIKNNSFEKILYRVTVLSGDENDMSKWIQVYPKILKIDARDESVLKVFGVSPEQTKEGLYRFKLQIEPINAPKLLKDKPGIISGKSDVSLIPIISMAGYVGNVDFSKTLELKLENLEMKNKELEINFNLENKGYAEMSVGATFKSRDGSIEETIILGKIDSYSKKNMKFNLKNFKNKKDVYEVKLYNSDYGEIKVIKFFN